jgi:hypothetical protein
MPPLAGTTSKPGIDGSPTPRYATALALKRISTDLDPVVASMHLIDEGDGTSLGTLGVLPRRYRTAAIATLSRRVA